MALTIKNPDVERLAEEVARLSGQNKTQAVRQALEERDEIDSRSVRPPQRVRYSGGASWSGRSGRISPVSY